MVFEKKKINVEILSEYLVQAREGLKMSPCEVANKTGIKLKFIENLESGNFSSLPADVYVFGFLRQLAQVYHIESEALIEQYKKERNIHEQLKSYSYSDGSPAKKYLNRIIVTPKYISIAVGGLFVALTFFYVIWQVFSINRQPSLEIFEPKDRQIVHGLTVDISGHTDPGMTLKINSQNVFVDSSGNFKTQVGISSGPQGLNFLVQNKFDKSVSRTLNIVGENQQQATSTPVSSVSLRLEFLYDTTINYAIDSDQPQSATFSKGTNTLLQAQYKIMLSAPDAGAIHATLNNQDLGVLGRRQEKLKDVTFSPGI